MVNKVTLRDLIDFAYAINSRSLLDQLKYVMGEELEEIQRGQHEPEDQKNQGDPVYILQINCGNKTPEENLVICEMLGLTDAAETWRSQIDQRGNVLNPNHIKDR